MGHRLCAGSLELARCPLMLPASIDAAPPPCPPGGGSCVAVQTLLSSLSFPRRRRIPRLTSPCCYRPMPAGSGCDNDAVSSFSG